MSKQKNYYHGLDILRFFAAFGVMNFHYFFTVTDKLSWYRYGNLGVQLFFIISGFVISQSIAHKNITDFAKGRLIRLFPLFWILCSLTYIFTLIMPNGLPVSFAEYLISMTMLGDKLSSMLGYGGLVDPSYWSLAVELIFYCAIGLFVYFFSWKNIRYFLWGWLLLSAVSFLLHIDQNFLMKMLLVRHASYFILGGAIALYIDSKYTTKLKKIGDISLIVVSLIYSTCISYIALPPYFMPNMYDADIIAIAHPILFFLVIISIYLSKKLSKLSIGAICTIIGGITYPLYLIHQTLGNTLIRFFVEVYGYSKIPITLSIEVIMIGLAYLAYEYDKELRAWLTKRL